MHLKQCGSFSTLDCRHSLYSDWQTFKYKGAAFELWEHNADWQSSFGGCTFAESS
jgi:hypothetical protein